MTYHCMRIGMTLKPDDVGRTISGRMVHRRIPTQVHKHVVIAIRLMAIAVRARTRARRTHGGCVRLPLQGTDRCRQSPVSSRLLASHASQ